LRGVFQFQNGSGDRSYSITGQLQKSFHSTELSGAYTYTDAKDRLTAGTDFSGINAATTPVDGSLEHRNLNPSLWERTHKITVVGTTDLPLGFRFSLTYIGMSGAPYSYVLLGDANGDGVGPQFGVSDDLVYVPKDAGDITMADPTEFAALNRYIRNEHCLQNQRGRLLERNSCQDPWVHETSARFAKRFSLGGGRGMEITADLFNVLNFVDSDWGLVRQTGGAYDHTVPLMEIVGYDTANGRGVYTMVPVSRNQIVVEASRWRVQLGGTLFF
jgi:hypothetical protein